MNSIYAAIDLKSFYASVECRKKNLDPLTTNLVVADESRTDKTICLAVSPSMKSHGLPGRCRLFEVRQAIDKINKERIKKAKGNTFTGSSCNDYDLRQNKELKLDCIIEPPHMKKYIEKSAEIFGIYLDFVSEEDIHAYSIDEVFINLSPYIRMYGKTAHEIVREIISAILEKTGITATAGIGTNLYLAKIAMDIMAKKVAADSQGVRIAELDEMTYRKKLWAHEPITDFWRIGKKTAERLRKYGIRTMGDIARISVQGSNYPLNEEILYKEFGINAELLIDHAWGTETCTMKEIKNYKSTSTSMSTGQILPCGYSMEKAKIIVREMAETLSLDLHEKKQLAENLSIYLSYEPYSSEAEISDEDEISFNEHGKPIPKPSHGTIKLKKPASTPTIIGESAENIYIKTVNKNSLVKRIVISVQTITENAYKNEEKYVEQDLFSQDDIEKNSIEKIKSEKESKIQNAILSMKSRYGKNAVIKGTNLQKGSMQIERNSQIGGHNA